MPKQSPQQKKTVERVMHEYKHGELKRAQGGKVKNPKQAIAIALHEAGASKDESPAANKRNLRRTKEKEHSARGKSARGRDSSEKTRAELYAEAKKRDIPGRSKMNKRQLEQALHG